MPRHITKVKRSASELPWGVSFNEATGTFSGTPEDIGEYIIPVTVQTNYGKDSKNVKMCSTKGYNVYVLGGNSTEMAKITDNEPDEYGFRKVDIPASYKLISNHRGFLAKTCNNKTYCVGAYDLNSSAYLTPTNLSSSSIINNAFLSYSKPIEIDNNIEEMKVGVLYYVYYSGGQTSSYGDWYDQIFILKRFSDNTGLYKTSTVFVWKYIYNAPSSTTSYAGSLARANVNIDDCCKLVDYPYIFCAYSVPYICNHGNSIGAFRCRNTSSGSYAPLITDLEYEAIKILPNRATSIYTPFQVLSNGSAKIPMLSDDKLTYNFITSNPFTLGEIKDIYYPRYVVTVDNKLYYYNTSDSVWELLGEYDVKKLICYYSSYASFFMLTNNGKMYHKGGKIGNLIEEHSEITQIFPDCYFHDFTYANITGGLLTVLKE